MRITIVTGPFYPVPPAPCGAVERIWHNLGEVFATQGHEVTVLCRHWPGQNKNETVNGVRYVRRMRLDHTRSIWWDLLQDLYYSLRMLLILPRADLTVTNVFWLPALLRLRRRRAGAVVVNVARWPKGQMKLYGNVDRLAATSGPIRDEVIRQTPKVAPLVKVLPNPIDTDAFVPRAKRVNSANATILYTGRVHPEKGVHLLVKSFRLLSESGEWPGLRLRVIGATSIAGGGGGESYIAELKQAAAGLNFEFVEPIYDRSALARELHAADVYCYPSLAEQGESFGVAPLEAMATGLAPVVSALQVFRDFLEPGVNGLVFDHRCADPAAALAQALRTLLADPELRERMGQAAARTGARFSNSAVARLYLDDFESLVSSRQGNAKLKVAQT